MKLVSKKMSLCPLFIWCCIICRIKKSRSDEVRCGIQEIENSSHYANHVLKYEYPWKAALFKSSPYDDEIFIGSGTIIGANRVLTVAHLLYQKLGSEPAVKPAEIKVVLGSRNLNDTKDTGRKEFSVEKIVISPAWHSLITSFDGDIAILFLTEDVTFSRYIQPICLPDQTVWSITTGETAGWCRTSLNRPEKRAIAILDNQKCFDKMQNIMPNDSICAGVQEHSFCHTISGDGFYVQKNGKFYLRGIASYFKHSGIASFTNVSVHLNFLQDNRLSIENLVSFDNDCGTSSQVTGKISNGDSFSQGLLPWLAALIKYEKSEKEKFICGGTLVSSRKVVTAAHCLHVKGDHNKLDHNKLRVLLGAHNLSASHEVGKVAVRIENYRIHESYNPSSVRFNGDIAVLILSEPAAFNSYIKPVCLSNSLPFIGNGIVAGWGRQENQKIGTSNKLPKKINIPIIDNQICFEKTPQMAVGGWDKSFCAGREGVSVCDGDSGSGFYVLINGKYYLKGIVSNSALYDDCSLGYYANFADAAEYMSFITSHSDIAVIARENFSYEVGHTDDSISFVEKNPVSSRSESETESWFTYSTLIIGILLGIIFGFFVWRENHRMNEIQNVPTSHEHQQLNAVQNISCLPPQLPMQSQLPYPLVMAPDLPTPAVTRKSIFFGWIFKRP